MVGETNPHNHDLSPEERSVPGQSLDLCITMLSKVSSLLEPGRDINQYTLVSLSSCYRDSGIVYRKLKEISKHEKIKGDDTFKKIISDLIDAMGHLETAIQLKKEHEGIIPMTDDKKSKGSILNEHISYRNQCYSLVDTIVDNFRQWRGQVEL